MLRKLGLRKILFKIGYTFTTSIYINRLIYVHAHILVAHELFQIYLNSRLKN